VSGTEALISIDTEAELEKIIQQLNSLPDQIAAPNILKNAINATARKVRKQLVKDAKGEYAIKNTAALKDESNGAPKVLTASTVNLSAAVQSRGPMQEIMTFMTRPNTKTGAAAAQVLASGSMKPLEMDGLKAFVTQFASGHVAIVQRKGAERLPVKKLLSPAVPFMLGNETVREKAETLAYETLQGEIDKRIKQVLNKV
jgi:hypothetical protein